MRAVVFITTFPLVLAAGCGGTRPEALCTRAGATGAAIELALDDGEVIEELYLDARVALEPNGVRTYGFGRDLGRVVTQASSITFALPLRSGAVVEGSGALVTDHAGMIEARVTTGAGTGTLMGCFPVR